MKLHQERYYRSDASMGPRARARGNEQCCDLGGGCIGASMGPRARARGNVAGIAELRCKRCGLQWGHERALVEIRGVRSLPRRRRSFNGATSARSWKYGLGFSGAGLLNGFNGATSARSWKSKPPGRWTVARCASMGPRARARGNRAIAVPGGPENGDRPI